MSFKNWEQATEYFSKKENVIEWFGERGIFLEEKKTKGCLHLSKFKWIDGKLFYSIKGDHDGMQAIDITHPYCLEMCYTHRKDGSSIDEYEAYDTFKSTFKDIPKLIDNIEKGENEWESLISEESKKFIKNLKVGDILEYLCTNKYMQVIEKIGSTIKVKLLKTYISYSDESLTEILYYSIKNDFSTQAKLEKLERIPLIGVNLYKGLPEENAIYIMENGHEVK